MILMLVVWSGWSDGSWLEHVVNKGDTPVRKFRAGGK